MIHELGLTVSEMSTKAFLADVITKSENYNEEVAKNLLSGFVMEQNKNERRL